jgi:hypothetical protein
MFWGESGCGSSKGVVKSGKYEIQIGGRQEGREGHWWGLGNPKWGGAGEKREK